MPFDSTTFGVVALAAYRPNWDLFRAQLRSIQNQTHLNFSCLIAADGGFADIEDFVARETGGDERFKVLGFDERLGFYGNFERVLNRVPAHAEWVALSDQDDSWYPTKLQVLLPRLNDVGLVAGQARVVRQPGNDVVADSTLRRDVDLGALIAQNQVTGSLCVFRRTLLEVALPFPRINTVTQVHDHWLAVCAKATEGALVVDDVVQDYVQHGGNVLGEVGQRKGIVASLRNLAGMSRKYRGHAGPIAILKTANDLSFGWRRTMADALLERAGTGLAVPRTALDAFQSGHRWTATAATLATGLRTGDVAIPCFLEFVAGAPVEFFAKPRQHRAM
jgi:hypothetical protein